MEKLEGYCLDGMPWVNEIEIALLKVYGDILRKHKILLVIIINKSPLQGQFLSKILWLEFRVYFS